MFKLDFLNDLQATKKNLNARRQETAKQELEAAYTALLKAKQARSGQKQKQLLLEALDKFRLALNNQRSNIDIYLGLSYICLLLRQPMQAVKYLKTARLLEPEHPDVQQMLRYAQKPDAAKAFASQQELAHSHTSEQEFDIAEKKADQIEDELEEIKEKQSDFLSQLPTHRSASLISIRRHSQSIDSDLKNHHKTLQGLDRYLDVLDLQQELQVLSNQQTQINQLITISSLMNRTLNQTEALYNEIHAFIKSQSPVSHSQLENYLDRCDQLADQLDSIDEKGHSIAQLEPTYSRLVEELELLQDLCEA